MPRILPLLPLILIAAPAFAQETPPDYLDDRSTPESLVTSLYNAIDRHEYLRGWSYFSADSAPDYPTFRDGYDTTDGVALRIGTVETDGAAGSIHSLVPVAIQAASETGETTVFTGCYRLTQVQPAAQDMPPFRPIQIDDGTLSESDEPFETAMGTCEP